MVSFMPNDWIFSKEFLDNSPSRHDGITTRFSTVISNLYIYYGKICQGLSAEKETSFRYKTVWFIEDLAQKLEGAERFLFS